MQGIGGNQEKFQYDGNPIENKGLYQISEWPKIGPHP